MKKILLVVYMLFSFSLFSCEGNFKPEKYDSVNELFDSIFINCELLKTFEKDDVAIIVYRTPKNVVLHRILYNKDGFWNLLSNDFTNTVDLSDCNGKAELSSVNKKNIVVVNSTLYKMSHFIISDTEDSDFEAFSIEIENNMKTVVFFTVIDDISSDYSVLFMAKQINFSDNKVIFNNSKTNDVEKGIIYWKDAGLTVECDCKMDEKELIDKEAAIKVSNEIIAKYQSMGYYKDYILQKVYYDIQDEVWITVYWADTENLMSAECQIALDKNTGIVKRMWVNEG